MGRANDRGVGLSLDTEIVAEAAFAGQQTKILLATNGLPDCAHDRVRVDDGCTNVRRAVGFIKSVRISRQFPEGAESLGRCDRAMQGLRKILRALAIVLLPVVGALVLYASASGVETAIGVVLILFALGLIATWFWQPW